MLRKLLPKLKTSLSLVQRLPKKTQPDQEQNPDHSESLSPNLLYSVIDYKKPVVVKSKLISLVNITILVLSVIILVLLSVNYYFDKKLARLVQERDAEIAQLNSAKGTEETVLDLIKVINAYKQTQIGALKISPYLDFVITTFTKHMRLISLEYGQEKKSFIVTAKSQSATSYAFLIADLLDSNLVESISLENVSLNPATHEYTAGLVVFLKK